MQTKKRFTDDSFRREPWFRALCQALLGCRTEEDMGSALRDIGTLSELQAWSERLEVAKQLANGLSYRQVAAVTGASTTTVTRVAKEIENGTGGYRKILHVHRHHRLMRQEERRRQESSSPSQVLSRSDLILQKYLDRK